MNLYSQQQYWDSRYSQDPEPFDWYQRFSSIKPLLLPVLNRFKEPRILHVGCGNSRVTEDLYQEGFKSIFNIDYADSCIKQLTERYAEYPELKFTCMDMREMTFESGVFDVVFDKGALDSVFCTENAPENVHKALKEISRVLQPAGVYFCLSYGVPDSRLPFINCVDYGWSVQVEKLPKPIVESLAPEATQTKDPKNDAGFTFHYIYICTRQASEAK